MTPRIGSLFSGYGGLDMAVQAVYGGEVAWYSEIDKHACTVLEALHPTVPNLGDITAVDGAAGHRIGYAEGQRDMLAKCIEVVRSMTIQFVGNSAATRDQVVDLLSALLVPATFVYTPACEFGLCDSCAYATECTCECHRLRAQEKP